MAPLSEGRPDANVGLLRALMSYPRTDALWRDPAVDGPVTGSYLPADGRRGLSDGPGSIQPSGRDRPGASAVGLAESNQTSAPSAIRPLARGLIEPGDGAARTSCRRPRRRDERDGAGHVEVDVELVRPQRQRQARREGGRTVDRRRRPDAGAPARRAASVAQCGPSPRSTSPLPLPTFRAAARASSTASRVTSATRRTGR